MCTLAGIALTLSACAGTAEIARHRAASELQCREDQLAVVYAGNGRYEVTGCHARLDYRCATPDLARNECVPLHETRTLVPAMEAQRVRHKAASLLACDASSLTVSAPSKERFTAEGCGRSVAYECVSHRDCCAFLAPGVQSIEDARAPAPEQARDHAGPTGSLPKREITAVIRARIGEVRACYEARLTGPPWPAGLVEIKFKIGTDGNVSAAAVARSSFDDASVPACIRDAIATWRFPVPDGGGFVVVTYPFVLETTAPLTSCR